MFIKIDKIKKDIKEADDKKHIEDLKNNEERLKKYNKDVFRYDRKSDEKTYICTLCNLEYDPFIADAFDPLSQERVLEGHFNIKLHIDNFNKKISIKVNKSIEDKFVDIIFDFKGLQNGFIYSDLYLKKIMKEKVIENTNKNKKYKTIILKIVRKKGNNNNNNNRPILNLITTKIKTDDVIKSIDNLERLHLTE